MSGVFRCIWLLALALILSSTCRTVGAATLEWNATADCSPDAFAQKFEQVTERQLHEAPGRAVYVSVRQDAASVWLLEVSIAHDAQEPTSTRSLKGVSCTDVSHAAAVAVAMALFEELPMAEESTSNVETTAAEAPDETLDRPKPVTTASRASVSSQSAEASTPWNVPVFAHAALDGSLLGEVALGFKVGLALARTSWEVSLSYSMFPSVTKIVEADLSVELGAQTGALAGCYLFVAPPVRPVVCVAYEAGVLTGEGTGKGLAMPRRQRTFWHAVRPEVGLHVTLRPALDMRFALGPALGLNRLQFVLDNDRVAHDVPVFSVRGSAGLPGRFEPSKNRGRRVTESSSSDNLGTEPPH